MKVIRLGQLNQIALWAIFTFSVFADQVPLENIVEFRLSAGDLPAPKVMRAKRPVALGLTPERILLSESFESGLGGWMVGDSNPAGVPAYWGVVDSDFGRAGAHDGTNKLYCAATGHTGPVDAPSYVGGMRAFVSRTLDLSNVTSATITFWSKIPSIETPWDNAKVFLDTTEIWSRDTAQPEWTEVELGLDSFVGGRHTLCFQFSSDFTGNLEGWYIDDVRVSDSSIASPPLPNDRFALAQPLVGARGSVLSNNRTATREPGEPTGDNGFTNSVWFSWTPGTSSLVNISVQASSFSPVVTVYSGTNLSSLSPVAVQASFETNNINRVSIEAIAGVAYRFSVRGRENLGGPFQLGWDQPAVEVRDLLPDLALWVDPAQSYLYGWYLDYSEIPGRTLLRLSSAAVNVGGGPLEVVGSSASPGVNQRIHRSDGSTYDRPAGTFSFDSEHGHMHFDDWMTFGLRSVLPDGGVGAFVAGGDKSSSALIDLQVYDSKLPGFPSIAQYHGGFVQGLSVGWADVYGADLEEQWIDVTGIAPGRYWLEEVVDPGNTILEADESNNVARLQIELTASQLTGSPPNDLFAKALPINGVSAGVHGSTAGASKERAQSEPNHGGNEGGASVWYTWTAPSDLPVTLSTDGSDFDVLVAVYTGSSVGSLSRVASNDLGSGGRTNVVFFLAQAATTYHIAVDGVAGETGNFELNFNSAWNDQLGHSIMLAGSEGFVTGSTRGATHESGEPDHGDPASAHSIWYSWTVPQDGLVAFDASGSSFPAIVRIYTGHQAASLSSVTNVFPSDTHSFSRFAFSALAETTYQIAVDGLRGSVGLVSLEWGGPAPPSITTQPLSACQEQGSTLKLEVEAKGWTPLIYQWYHTGTNLTDNGRIVGASSPKLVVNGLSPSDAGTYTVLVANEYGSAKSYPANVIVIENPRAIYFEAQAIPIGGTVAIPIKIFARGDEQSLNFSVVFDPAVLGHPRLSPGADSSNSNFSLDTNAVAVGEIGVRLQFPKDQPIAAGMGREVVQVLFDAREGVSAGTTTSLGFGDAPVPRDAAAADGITLYPSFSAATFTLMETSCTLRIRRTAGDEFQISGHGIPGRDYQLLNAGNLLSESWIPSATNRTSLRGSLIFSNSLTNISSRHFYRAQILPRSD